eukprot:482816-Amphidinium_carterae.1
MSLSMCKDMLSLTTTTFSSFAYPMVSRSNSHLKDGVGEFCMNSYGGIGKEVPVQVAVAQAVE